jgi:hypothetical protein
MNKKNVLLTIIVTLLFFLTMIGTGFTQTQPSTEAPKAKQHNVTMNGKIIHQQYGGYSVIRVKPHEEYKIVNEDEPILSELTKKGEVVKIEGHLVRGAYFLVIDKINGKEYPGKK